MGEDVTGHSSVAHLTFSELLKKKPFNAHCHLPDRDNGAGPEGS